MNRRPVRHADVDPCVQPSPAVAERARDRTVHRPDQALRRWGGVGGPLRRRELPADACILSRQRIRLGDQLPFLPARRCELAALAAAPVRETPLAREQLTAGVLLLLRAHRDHLRLGVHASSHRLRALSRDVNLVACIRHRRGDVLVLARDRLEVVNLVERVLQRRGRENHVDERRVARLVDVDHAEVQLTDDACVLTSQEPEPLRLEGEEGVELVEPALVELEILSQHREPSRHVADLAFERPDLRGDAGDLRRQPRLFRPRRRDPRLNGSDLPAVVTGGRGGQCKKRHENEGQSAGHTRKVRQGVGRPCRQAPRAPSPIFRTCGDGWVRLGGGGLSRNEDLEEELLDWAGLGESCGSIAGADGGEVRELVEDLARGRATDPLP